MPKHFGLKNVPKFLAESFGSKYYLVGQMYRTVGFNDYFQNVLLLPPPQLVMGKRKYQKLKAS